MFFIVSVMIWSYLRPPLFSEVLSEKEILQSQNISGLHLFFKECHQPYVPTSFLEKAKKDVFMQKVIYGGLKDLPKSSLSFVQQKVAAYQTLKDAYMKSGEIGEAHHMPLNHYMKIFGVRREEGICVWISPACHKVFHQKLVKQPTYLAPRDALAQAIRRFRKIHEQQEKVQQDDIRALAQEIIRLNKQKFPYLFEKKKKN